MSGMLDAVSPAAACVIQAVATSLEPHALSAMEHSAAGPALATALLAYAEVIATLPASDGARLDPWALDDLRVGLVRATERAGAARAAAIVLVNPSEIAPRLTVLALANWGEASASVDHAADVITATIEGQVSGFVLAQPVVVDELRDVPTSTLTPEPVTHRIDVLLAWKGLTTTNQGGYA